LRLFGQEFVTSWHKCAGLLQEFYDTLTGDRGELVSLVTCMCGQSKPVGPDFATQFETCGLFFLVACGTNRPVFAENLITFDALCKQYWVLLPLPWHETSNQMPPYPCDFQTILSPSAKKMPAISDQIHTTNILQ